MGDDRRPSKRPVPEQDDEPEDHPFAMRSSLRDPSYGVCSDVTDDGFDDHRPAKKRNILEDRSYASVIPDETENSLVESFEESLVSVSDALFLNGHLQAASAP